MHNQVHERDGRKIFLFKRVKVVAILKKKWSHNIKHLTKSI